MKGTVIVGVILGFLFLFPGCRDHASPPSIPEETLKLYLKGKSAYLDGNIDEAESYFEKSVAASPGFYQAKLMLAKSCFYQGDSEVAASLLAELLERRPCFKGAELMLIRIHLEGHELDKAQKRLERLLSYDATDPRLLSLQARVCREQEDLSGALDFLKQACLFSEEYAHMYLELGRLYYQFGRKAKACGQLETALHLLGETSGLRAPVNRLLETIREEMNSPSVPEHSKEEP
jgi:tetratricopeptide (TPR) repeat protein